MEAGHFVWEEPYEVRFDMHGFTDGPPMRGRLGAMEKVPLLVYVSLPCSVPTRNGLVFLSSFLDIGKPNGSWVILSNQICYYKKNYFELNGLLILLFC